MTERNGGRKGSGRVGAGPWMGICRLSSACLAGVDVVVVVELVVLEEEVGGLCLCLLQEYAE